MLIDVDIKADISERNLAIISLKEGVFIAPDYLLKSLVIIRKLRNLKLPSIKK